MSLIALRSKLEQWLNRQWLKRGVWAWSMLPLAVVYGLILKIRLVWLTRQTRPNEITIPVLIVGNIYIGGTGKTPIVIALIKALRKRGWHPGVVSRGYGTHIGHHPLLGQGTLDAKRFGDEPALISSETQAPVAVHPNRTQACKDLLKRFPDVDLVISDDGLQHLKLKRDVELVVQDYRGTGNGWLLPAGPLREPVSRLKSVHGILTRDDETHAQSSLADLAELGADLPCSVRKTSASLGVNRFKNLATGQVLSVQAFVARAHGKNLSAAAGIAKPERFFQSLRKLDLVLSETLALPDHFSFETSPFISLKSELIVVTSKDAVKLGSLREPRLWVAEAEISFGDPEFIIWLDQALQDSTKRSATI